MPIDLDKLSPTVQDFFAEEIAIRARMEKENAEGWDGMSYLEEIDPSDYREATPEEGRDTVRYANGDMIHCNGISKPSELQKRSDRVVADLEAKLSKISGPKNTP